MLALVQDAETGQRDYLLSSDPDYLQPYRLALAEPESRRDDLARSVMPDSVQSGAMERLLRLIETKMSELRRTVADFDRGDAAAAMATVRSDIGRRTMIDIHEVIEAMLARARDILDQYAAEAAVARRWLQVGAVVVVLLTLLLSFLALREVVALLRETTASRDQHEVFNRDLEALVAARIAVAGRRDGEQYRTVWRGIGGPPVSRPPEQNGFATTLTTASVKGQLGGTIAKRWLTRFPGVTVSFLFFTACRLRKHKKSSG